MKKIKSMLYRIIVFITRYEWYKVEDIEWRTLPYTHIDGIKTPYTYIKGREENSNICITPGHKRIYLFNDKRMETQESAAKYKLSKRTVYSIPLRLNIVGISTKSYAYKEHNHAIRCTCDRCTWSWHKQPELEHIDGSNWKPEYGTGTWTNEKQKQMNKEANEFIKEGIKEGRIKFVDTSSPDSIKNMFKEIKNDLNAQS